MRAPRLRDRRDKGSDVIEISDAAHLRICRQVGICKVLNSEERDGELRILVRQIKQGRVVTLVIPAGDWRTVDA